MTEKHEERLKEAIWASHYKKDLRDAISAALDEIDRFRAVLADTRHEVIDQHETIVRLEARLREFGAKIDE